MSDLVGNPEDRFSHDAAHIITEPELSEYESAVDSSREVEVGGGHPLEVIKLFSSSSQLSV